MTEMHDDLRELGRRLWPDDSTLRPAGTGRHRSSRAVARGRVVATAVTVATAAVMLVVLTAAVALHGGDRGAAPGVASSAHGRGSGSVGALHMIDGAAGWAWGPTLVTHTGDGAATLVDVTPAGLDSSHQVLMAEDFLDAEHAWIVVRPASGVGGLTLYRTGDGGARWTATALSVDSTSTVTLTFVDDQHGWLEVSRSRADHLTYDITLLRTLDGGTTWAPVYRTAQRNSLEPNGPKGTCLWSTPVFTTTQAGFAGLSCDDGGPPRLDVTRDGGSTWERTQLPPPPSQPAGTLVYTGVGAPTFVSPLDGVAAVSLCIGDGGTCRTNNIALYRTADGGRSWAAGGLNLHVNSVVLADLDHGWAPGGPTELLATEDGGGHWTTLTVPQALAPGFGNYVRYQFVSPTLGYAVSLVGRAGPSHTYFYRTTDGGRDFVEFTPRVVSPAR